MVFDMFMPQAPPFGLRCFRNRSLHSSIRNFLLLCDSAVMFRELKLVRGMRAESAAELMGYSEKPPA
jgi:hypothetical protein